MNTNPTVDQFFADKTHPLEAEMQKVRKIILSSHPDITEAIKWKVPTFMYKGNIASFMNAKKHVSLMFHKGALIADQTGLLEGDGKEARVARFYDMSDIKAKSQALSQVISAWVQLQDQ